MLYPLSICISSIFQSCSLSYCVFVRLFLKAFLDTMIPFLLCMFGRIFLNISGEGHVPIQISMVLMVVLSHPLSWFVMLFAFKLFQNMTVYHHWLIVFFVDIGLNYFLAHVSDFFKSFNKTIY